MQLSNVPRTQDSDSIDSVLAYLSVPRLPIMARSLRAIALAVLALPLAGTPPVELLGARLNGDLARAQIGGLRNVQVSPDGGWLLYLAFEEATYLYELYVGPADLSSEPVRLSADLGAQEHVLRARFTPDSARVVYEVSNEGYVDG